LTDESKQHTGYINNEEMFTTEQLNKGTNIIMNYLNVFLSL